MLFILSIIKFNFDEIIESSKYVFFKHFNPVNAFFIDVIKVSPSSR